MSNRILLQILLKGSVGLVQSICACTILFVLLLTASDTIRFASIISHIQQQSCCEGRSLFVSAISTNIKKNHFASKQERNFLSGKNESEPAKQEVSNYLLAQNQRDKYSEWIPYPQQKLSALSNDPYAIQNSDICRSTENLGVIVLIHSATDNFKRRQGIRNTWGNVTRHNTMRIVFLLGLTENNKTQRNIVQESDKYRDIVQGKFIDTYQNLTHKAVLGLRWVKEFCPGEFRVLKVDDDVFIDTIKLFSKFVNDFENKQEIIYCKRQDANTSQLQRMSNEKWKVSENEFRKYNYFPLTYCHGFFISMSSTMASKLFEAAYKMPFFWIDDFYVYGMLTDMIGVSANIFDIHHLLSLHTYNSLNCFGSEDRKCNLLIGNAPSKEFMQLMWNKLLNQNKAVYGKILLE